MDRSVGKLTAIRHRVAAALRPLTRNLKYTVRSGLAAGLRRQGGLGFLPRQPTVEEEFWNHLSGRLRDAVVYDIGSYEGIFSIFAASRVGNGHVVVIEPNPECLRMTERNIRCNRFESRSTLLNVGLGSAESRMTIVYPKGEPARGSVDGEIIDLLRREGIPLVETTVRICRLDDLFLEKRLPSPQFIKIDVEGHEYEVLKGAESVIRGSRPELVIEIHGTSPEEKLRQQAAVHSLLDSWGYTTRTFSGALVAGADRPVGHLHCVPFA